jgi:hypothetical protein
MAKAVVWIVKVAREHVMPPSVESQALALSRRKQHNSFGINEFFKRALFIPTGGCSTM